MKKNGTILFFAGIGLCVGQIVSSAIERIAAPYEFAVAAYEAADRLKPPPEGAVLFVGSSSIELWADLEKDFIPWKTVNRGISGTVIADWNSFVSRLVVPYKPSKIVFYAGDNDTASGATPEQVLNDFQAFVTDVQTSLPNVKIYFISIKPSPARKSIWPVSAVANKLIADYAKATEGVIYVNTADRMLCKGRPRPELFTEDQLHLNRRGYVLWRRILRPILRAKHRS